MLPLIDSFIFSWYLAKVEAVSHRSWEGCGMAMVMGNDDILLWSTAMVKLYHQQKRSESSTIRCPQTPN